MEMQNHCANEPKKEFLTRGEAQVAEYKKGVGEGYIWGDSIQIEATIACIVIIMCMHNICHLFCFEQLTVLLVLAFFSSFLFFKKASIEYTPRMQLSGYLYYNFQHFLDEMHFIEQRDGGD